LAPSAESRASIEVVLFSWVLAIAR
jgi:hypothetical protein